MHFKTPQSRHTQFKKLINELKKVLADHDDCLKSTCIRNEPEKHALLVSAQPLLDRLKIGEKPADKILSNIPSEFHEAIEWFFDLPQIERDATFSYYDRASTKKQFHRKKSKASSNIART